MNDVLTSFAAQLLYGPDTKITPYNIVMAAAVTLLPAVLGFAGRASRGRTSPTLPLANRGSTRARIVRTRSARSRQWR